MPDMTTTCPTCGSEDNKFCSDAFHFHPTPPTAAEALREAAHEALIRKIKEEAEELEIKRAIPYAEIYPQRDGLFWKTRAILAEQAYTAVLAGHASLDAEVETLKGDVQLLEAAKHDANDWRKRLAERLKNCEAALEERDKETLTLRAEVETLRKERDEAKGMLTELDEQYQKESPMLRSPKAATVSFIARVVAERDTLTAQLAEAKAEVERVRPSADAYEGICRQLGLQGGILGFVNTLRTEITELKTEVDTQKESVKQMTEALVAVLSDGKVDGQYVHLPTCSGSRRVPAGETGYCCSCGIKRRFSALRSEIETLRKENTCLTKEVERLSNKTNHMFRLIHDRFHECGQFRNPNLPNVEGD